MEFLPNLSAIHIKETSDTQATYIGPSLDDVKFKDPAELDKMFNWVNQNEQSRKPIKHLIVPLFDDSNQFATNSIC